jgi:hypothetical protein
MRTTNSAPVFCALLSVAIAATAANARDPVPPNPKGRDVFVGAIGMMPHKGSGFWRVASRQITTSPMTQIVTIHGGLQIGTCVEVEMLGERVLRIESLNPADC